MFGRRKSSRPINKAGLELIKHYEGCSLEAYQDTGGVWTIGYGHTGVTARNGMNITQKKAEKLLREDLAWAEKAVIRFLRVGVNDNEYAALVSFVFNVGMGAFRRSTLLRMVNLNDFFAAEKEFGLWKYDDGIEQPGLVARREAEVELWNNRIPNCIKDRL
jgi:lysozyme